MVTTRAQKPKNRLASPSGRSNRSAIASPPSTRRVRSTSSAATPGSRRTADDSSTEVEYSDSDTDSKSVATSASNKTQSSREKLQLYIEKQLLIDIENSGGIASFREGKTAALADILNNPERQEIYGPKLGRIREKIRKRVFTFDKWLKKPGGYQKYYKHLAKIGVKSGAKGRGVTRPSTPAKEPPEAIHEEPEEDVSDLEDSETKPRAKATTKKQAKVAKDTSVPAKEVSPVSRTTQVQQSKFATVTETMTTTYGMCG